MVRKTDNPIDPTGPPELPTETVGAGGTVTGGDVSTQLGDDVAVTPAQLDTPESDAAVDAIVAEEADQVLAAQDAGIAAEQDSAEPVEEEKHGHPVFWFIIVFFVVLAMIFAYVLMNPDLNLPFSA